jgi:hypothetical protein
MKSYPKKASLILASALAVTMVMMPASTLAAFSTPLLLSPASTPSTFPQIDAQTSSIIHTVWSQQNGNATDIIYARSGNGGNTFPTNNRINLSNTPNDTSTAPQIKVDAANNINIVWEEQVNGVSEIMYRRSTNGGTSFSTAVALSNTSHNSTSPTIDTGGSNRIHVAWVDEDPDTGAQQLAYTTSADGTTFTSPTVITNVPHNVALPTVRSVGNTVGIVWQADGGGEYGIYRILSTNAGSSFGTVLRISSDNTTKATDASMTIDGSNNVHILAALLNPNTQFEEIYYYRSLDGGSTFSAGIKLSTTTTENSQLPVIVPSSTTNVHATWSQSNCTDSGCVKNIMRTNSSNNGATWSNPAVTSIDSTSIEDSDAEVIGTTAYVVYQEDNAIKFMKGN